METQVIQTNSFEEKKQTVNRSIKICVDCGSISVQIENYGIFCKECGTFFEVSEGKNWVKIPAGVSADIMMQTHHLEILKLRYLESFVQHVI